MNIIQKQPNPSGAYPAPQLWQETQLPEGYVIIPDTIDMTDFYAYNGFVTLTIENEVVTGYEPNVEAWKEWKASLPAPESPTMSLEEAILDKLTELEYRQDLISLGLEGGATI